MVCLSHLCRSVALPGSTRSRPRVLEPDSITAVALASGFRSAAAFTLCGGAVRMTLITDSLRSFTDERKQHARGSRQNATELTTCAGTPADSFETQCGSLGSRFEGVTPAAARHRGSGKGRPCAFGI